MNILENKELSMALAGFLAYLISAVLRQVLKDRAESAEDLLRSGVELAFNMVNDKAKLSESKVDDKVALGLGYLRDHYKLQGKKLTEKDTERAKMLFSAMHGAEPK